MRALALAWGMILAAPAAHAANLEVVVDQGRPICPLAFETSDGRTLQGGAIRCGTEQVRFTIAQARSRSGVVLYKERRGIFRCSVITLHVASFEARDRVAGTLVYKTNCLSGEKRSMPYEARFVDGQWRFMSEGLQAHCLNVTSSNVGVRTMEWDTREECAR